LLKEQIQRKADWPRTAPTGGNRAGKSAAASRTSE